MTRLRRYCPAGLPVHIIQRGNNRSDCFNSAEDKAIFIKYLAEATATHHADVHAWVLMSNHVHLLVTPSRADSVSSMMQRLGHQYVRFFNRKYSRTGTLWEGRFRSCLVQTEHYFLVCQRYIELNPVRSGMVECPADFHWSSYKANALGIETGLVKPHDIYLSLGSDEDQRLQAYRALFDEIITANQIAELRDATNKGLVFGSTSFKDQIAEQSGQRTRVNKRGRKALGAKEILL